MQSCRDTIAALTFLSRSDPNSERLLSFQSYFLALTRPDIVAAQLVVAKMYNWASFGKGEAFLCSVYGRNTKCGHGLVHGNNNHHQDNNYFQ